MLGAEEKCNRVYELKKQLDRMELDQVSYLFVLLYLDGFFYHFARLQIAQAWDTRSKNEDCKAEVFGQILEKLDKAMNYF
jgi:hypothetical protein